MNGRVITLQASTNRPEIWVKDKTNTVLSQFSLSSLLFSFSEKTHRILKNSQSSSFLSLVFLHFPTTYLKLSKSVEKCRFILLFISFTLSRSSDRVPISLKGVYDAL